MTKDEVINQLRAALKPLAQQDMKEEMPGEDRFCDMNDEKMDEIIQRARDAMALVPSEHQSTH